MKIWTHLRKSRRTKIVGGFCLCVYNSTKVIQIKGISIWTKGISTIQIAIVNNKNVKSYQLSKYVSLRFFSHP